MYSIVSENNNDVHVTLNTYIIHTLTKKNINDQFGNLLIFHGSFDTEKQADKYMEKLLLGNAKTYTKLLIETSMPNPIPEECRKVLVHIESHLTPHPNFYKISLHEYVILKNNFGNSVRFPTLEEFDTIKIVSDVIVIHEHVFSTIKNLFGDSTLTFVEASPIMTPEFLEKYERNMDNLDTIAWKIRNHTF